MRQSTELRNALAELTKALSEATEDRTRLRDEIDRLSKNYQILDDQTHMLQDTVERLREMLGPQEDGPPVPVGVRPTTTVAGVRQILHEKPDQMFSINGLLVEFERRGWVDPRLKTPGPTIYQAARRAADRKQGVKRVGKKFMADDSVSEEAFAES